MQKKSIQIIIQNKYGIHARPAALLVKTASKYKSTITLTNNKNIKVSAKSIMGLITSEISCGSKIKITAIGIDAQQALDDLQKLINDKFYFQE